VDAVAGAQFCFVGQHLNGTNGTFLELTHHWNTLHVSNFQLMIPFIFFYHYLILYHKKNMKTFIHMHTSPEILIFVFHGYCTNQLKSTAVKIKAFNYMFIHKYTSP